MDPAEHTVIGIELALGLLARRHGNIVAVIVAGQHHRLVPALLAGMGFHNVGDMGHWLVDAGIGRVLVRRPDNAGRAVFTSRLRQYRRCR